MTDPHVLTEAAVLAAREVGGGVAAHGPVARGLELEGVATALDARPAHLAPVLAPAVAHVPVLDAVLVHAPADDRDFVVDHIKEGLHVVRENAPRVVEQRDGVHAAADGAALLDL